MSGARLLGLVVLLSVSAAGAGDSSLELTIPKEVEKGLEKVGIKIETERSWLEEPATWIAGAVAVAGVTIAYTARRRKA